MFARHGERYRVWAVVAVMLGAFAAVMEATIVNIALPDIIRSFGIGQDLVQLVSTGFLAATTGSMLASGWAIARFGIRAPYVWALWLLMLFSILAAITPTGHFWLLAACRIGQGAIAGLIQPLAMLAIVDVFPAHQRGRAMSAYGLGIVLSPAIGPVVGGLLVDHLGWRSVFLMTLPFCLAAAALAPRYVVRGRPAADVPKRPLDMPGLILLVIALAALLGGLSAVFAHPATALALIAVGLAVAAAFIFRQARSAHPLLDFRLFRQHGFGAAIIVTVAYGMGLYGSTYLGPLFAQEVARFSAFEAGIMLIPGGIMLALVLMVSGRITDRTQPHRVVMAGLACFAGAAALLAASSAGTGFWALAAWVTLGRIGLGLVIPGLNAGALHLLPAGAEAAGSAAVNFFRQLGGAFGVTLLALFLEARQRAYAGAPEAEGLHGWLQRNQGFTEGFCVIAALYALALIPAWRMAAPHTERK